MDGLVEQEQKLRLRRNQLRTAMKPLIPLLLSAHLCSAAIAAPTNEATHGSIFDAIRSGDMTTLGSVLSQAGQISSRDNQANTPLIHAAAYADAKTVWLLLEKGADPNATNNAGVTALMRAAGDYEKVRLLLRHGADPNRKSALGNTALMIAARSYPSAKTVDALLKKGADIQATNVFGASAILTAAASGDRETLRLLIQHGADVNAV